MQLTTVDSIARRSLLEQGLPIHYYFEKLLHICSGLRELHIDTLQVVNTIQIGFDENGSAMLPDDFTDDVGVSLNGGSLQMLPHQDYISPIRVHNATTGAFESQNSNLTENTTDGSFLFGFATGTWFWNVDSYGEFTGSFYGANGGTTRGYKVIREQRRIQMSSGFENGSAVFIYISDGQSIDNASQIDIKAIKCLQNYEAWKTSSNRGNEFSPEGRAFYSSKKQLRARMNPMTVVDVRQIILRAYTATAKN